MKVPAMRLPMVTPAEANSEMDDGRSACRHMMRRSLSPLERAIVMKSSCSVEIRSFRSKPEVHDDGTERQHDGR